MGAALGIAGMGSRQRPGPPARVGVTAKAAKHCPEAVVGVAWSGTGGVDARRAHCGRFDAHERRAEPLARPTRGPRGTPMPAPILHSVRAKHPRVRLLGLALGLSALLAVAVPVYAAEPVGVDIQGCSASGGATTVPAGAEIDLFAGWAAQTRGQD